MLRCTALLLGLLVLILSSPAGAEPLQAQPPDPEEDTIVHRAMVTGVEKDDSATSQQWGEDAFTQIVTVEFTSGPRDGDEHTLQNHITGNPAYDLHLSEGNTVLIGETAGDLYVMDFARDSSLMWLVLVFVVAILLVAGRRGASVVITLVLTGLAVYYVLIPAVLAGRNPVLMAIMTSAVIVSLTAVLVLGVKGKTLAAAVGTITGVSAAAAVAHIWSYLSHLMGLHTQDAQILYHSMETPLDFRGLLLAGMILGALGAIIDVCVSIASAVEEIHSADSSQSMRRLFGSGLNVGRDILGTMANTLILAYAGGALPLLLLLTAHRMDGVKVINLDLIATEVVRAMSGSIGMVLCVPVTALTAAYIQTRRRRGIRNARSVHRRRPRRSERSGDRGGEYS